MPRLDVRSIRRDQILDAAERLVAQKGWAHTSFAEICREADVSNGVLTYHFKDKDDLLLALYERTATCWRDHLGLDQVQGCGLGDHLTEMVREASAAVDEDREIYLLLLHYLSQTTDHPEIAARIGSFFAEIRGCLAAKIEEAWAAAGITGRDPAVAASVMHGAMMGYLLTRSALDLKVPPEEMARMLAGYVMDSRSPIR